MGGGNGCALTNSIVSRPEGMPRLALGRPGRREGPAGHASQPRSEGAHCGGRRCRGFLVLPLQDEKGSGGDPGPRRVVRKEGKEEEAFAWRGNENSARQCSLRARSVPGSVGTALSPHPLGPAASLGPGAPAQNGC